MNSRMTMVAAGFAIALLATGMRAVHLTADPPLSIEVNSPFSIEGQIVHNARSRVLFGTWVPDQWDLTALAAGPTFGSAAAFALLGTNLAAARAPSIALSFLSFLLFYAILARGFGTSVAVFGSLLFATNAAAAMIMRLALPAVWVVFFALLATWSWSWASHPRWGAAGAGVASAAAAACDATGIVVLLAGVIVSILVRLHAWKMTWLPEARARIRAYWGGVAGAAAVWLAALALPHWSTTRATFPFMDPFAHSLKALLLSILFAPHELGKIFRLFPLVVLVIAINALFLSRQVMRLVARHRPLAPERLWMFAWLLAALLFGATLQSRPMRTLLFLVPPMTAFAAEGLLKLAAIRKIERVEIGFPVFFFWETTVVWFGTQWAFRSWVQKPGARVPAVFMAHANRSEFATVMLLSLAISFTVVLAYRRWRNAKFGIRVPRALVIGIVVVAFAFSLGIGLAQYRAWLVRPHYRVEEAQHVVAALPQGGVAGTWAPLLCLPSRDRALMWRDRMNAAPLPSLGVRWLLLEEDSREEIGNNALVSRFDPALAHEADLRLTFHLGKHEVDLFDVSPATARR